MHDQNDDPFAENLMMKITVQILNKIIIQFGFNIE